MDTDDKVAILIFVVGMALIAGLGYLKIQVYGGDTRCLIYNCVIEKK